MTCPYDSESTRAVSREPQRLDPITCAGSCTLEKVDTMAKEANLVFGIEAIKITQNADHLFKPGQMPQELNDHRPTGARYEPHIADLTKSKIIHCEGRGPSGVKYVNGYFSIPKDETCDRAILNAKRLSTLFVTPSTVNLQPIGEFFTIFIWLITSIGAACKDGIPRVFCYVCDLRHWFHQIRLGKRLSQYFGVHIGDAYYRWLTLPMGWSWSPRICQSIAWTLLLWHKDQFQNDDGMRQTRAEMRGARDPPRFAWLRNDAGLLVGVVTLTYDNVCFVCTDPLIAACLKRKIESNFKLATVVVKESSVRFAQPQDMIKPLDMTDEAAKEIGFCHLGVQYAVITESGVFRATWRHDPSRVEKWNATLDGLALVSTRREIARACGVVIWHWTIRTRPLCYASELILIIRGISARKKSEWDERPDSFSPMDLSYLKAELKQAIANAWIIGRPKPKVTSTYNLFSDASKLRMGGVFTNQHGEVLECWPRRFPKGFEEAHIYLKELGAIVWFAIAFVTLYKLTEVRLVIVTDNAAAFFSLTHFYSTNKIACRWLVKLTEFLDLHKITIDLVLVGTLDNPSDTPSRGVNDVEPGRLRRGLRAVALHDIGRRFTSTEKVQNENTDLRHREPAVGEEEEWDELFDNIVDPASDFSAPDYLESWDAPFAEDEADRKRPRNE